MKDFSHGQLAAPCVDRVMSEFINRASVNGLDVSCTRDAIAMPFFTSLNGRRLNGSTRVIDGHELQKHLVR